MIIQEGIKLYHGSYTIVKRPDLSKCMNGKDFGKGFYLTTDVYQARRFVKTAIGKAVKNGAVGSDSADRFAIGLLMPERLTDQVCIRTKTAIDRIKFIDVEEYEF